MDVLKWISYESALASASRAPCHIPIVNAQFLRGLHVVLASDDLNDANSTRFSDPYHSHSSPLRAREEVQDLLQYYYSAFCSVTSRASAVLYSVAH